MTDDARAALVERAKTLFSEWHSGAFPTIPAAPWEIIGEVAQTGWIYAAEQEHRREQAAMERMRELCAQYRDRLAEVKRKDAERQVSSSLRHDSQHQMVRHMDHAKAIRALALPDATGEG